MKQYLLGLDIGNTKTQYALADTDGNIVATVYDVGASHENLGPDGAQAAITEGIGKVIAAAGIKLEKIKYIYYGAAGADTEDDFKVLREVYKKVTPDIPFDFENDGYIALKSGTIDGVGMLVTNGTSNTNFAMNAKGELKRIGGLSFHTGDTLGAVNIALFVCRAAIRGEDGRAYPTVISRLIPEAFDLKEVDDIKNVPLFPENIQKVVEIFFEAARMGDGVALELTWMLVKETLHIVDQFHRDLFDHGEKFKLVLDGSVFKQKYQPFMNMLELCLNQRYRSSIQIVVPEWDPVLGAVFHAFEKSGLKLTREISDRMIRTYIEKESS
jgi:N-acetylglucosamine kinase-like BadF-type ATPase